MACRFCGAYIQFNLLKELAHWLQSHSLRTEMKAMPGGIPKVMVEAKAGAAGAESILKMGVEVEAREGSRVRAETEMEENPQLREVETEGNLQADAERNHQTKMERLLEEAEGASHEEKDRRMKTI
jgi:hypothetical protein